MNLDDINIITFLTIIGTLIVSLLFNFNAGQTISFFFKILVLSVLLNSILNYIGKDTNG